MQTLLISLHPRHSQNILAGKKTIELRKRPVDLSRFDHILIYETLPTAAIIGYCEPWEGEVKTAQDWGNFKNSLCLTSEEIYNYLGDRMGYGIRIKNPQKITPISLSKMREASILPPQSFRYLSDIDLQNLGIRLQ